MFEDKSLAVRVCKQITDYEKSVFGRNTAEVMEVAFLTQAYLTTKAMEECNFNEITGNNFKTVKDLHDAINRVNKLFRRYSRCLTDMMLLVPAERGKPKRLCRMYLAHTDPLSEVQIEGVRTNLNAQLNKISSNVEELVWI